MRASCQHRLTPRLRRITELIGRVQGQPLGDVLGVAINDPRQITRAGEHRRILADGRLSVIGCIT
jgi:hypothetical protein